MLTHPRPATSPAPVSNLLGILSRLGLAVSLFCLTAVVVLVGVYLFIAFQAQHELSSQIDRSMGLLGINGPFARYLKIILVVATMPALTKLTWHSVFHLVPGAKPFPWRELALPLIATGGILAGPSAMQTIAQVDETGLPIHGTRVYPKSDGWFSTNKGTPLLRYRIAENGEFWFYPCNVINSPEDGAALSLVTPEVRRRYDRFQENHEHQEQEKRERAEGLRVESARKDRLEKDRKIAGEQAAQASARKVAQEKAALAAVQIAAAEKASLQRRNLEMERSRNQSSQQQETRQITSYRNNPPETVYQGRPLTRTIRVAVPTAVIRYHSPVQVRRSVQYYPQKRYRAPRVERFQPRSYRQEVRPPTYRSRNSRATFHRSQPRRSRR